MLSFLFAGEGVAALDTYHLLAPLIVSWVLTTVGVGLYYVAGVETHFFF
eukprot:COSAG06_NODE_1819_length_8293_cov_39.705394_12_plen_49_part_00